MAWVEHKNVIIKWLGGGCAFILPAVIAVIGMRLDRSEFRNDPLYGALVPVAGWSAISLAIIVPAVLLMTARMPLLRRIGLTAAVWCLLLLEFYLIFIAVMSAHW